MTSQSTDNSLLTAVGTAVGSEEPEADNSEDGVDQH